MVAESDIFQNAKAAWIAGFAFNCILLIVLVVVLFCLTSLATEMKRHTFSTVAIRLIKVRRRMKYFHLSLDEFLHLCNLLGITRQQIMEIYREMHRNRREMGESWLFDDDAGDLRASVRKSVRASSKEDTRRKTTISNGRRQMPIFRSFAATSQFTQGFEGFRMHRLLNEFRGAENPAADDAPEMMTTYEVSAMCTTMQKLADASSKKADSESSIASAAKELEANAPKKQK